MDHLDWNDIRGSYTPVFFNLYLNSPLSLESVFSDPIMSTLIHEYVHFLQDTSTLYGLGNLCTTLSQIQQIYKDVHGKALAHIRIPVQISYTDIGPKINRDLYRIYFGTPSYAGLATNAFIKTISTATKMIHGVAVPEFSADIHVPNSKPIDYRIGAHGICESMARLAQRIVYPSSRFDWAVAYNMLDLLNRYYSTNYTDIQLFALCECALSVNHPAEALLDLFQNPPTNYSPLSNFFLELETRTANATRGQQIPRFNAAAQNALQHVSAIMNNSASVDAGRWACSLIRAASEKRSDSFLFLSETLSGQPDEIPRRLIELMRGLGSPLVRNNRSEVSIWPNPEMQQTEFNSDLCSLWLGVSEIYEKLNDQRISPCSLEPFCRLATDPPEVDQRCQSEPWSRAKDLKLCPFGHVWRMWGFSDKGLQQ